MLGQRFGDVVVHSHEDNGGEHSGHGEDGAAADRQHQRFVLVAKPLADACLPGSMSCSRIRRWLLDFALEPGRITAMEIGPRDARGKDEPVPSGEVEVIDVQQAAALPPVTLPQRFGWSPQIPISAATSSRCEM